MSGAGLLGIAGDVCLAVGSLFAVIGGIGIVRLPEFYARLHGGGITDTLGAGLVLCGLMLHAGPTLITVKLVTILFFLLITSPTSAHALSQSARAHVQPVVTSKEDPPSSR